MINDLPVGRNPEEVLRLVQAFQFTGMCRPGSLTFSNLSLLLTLL
jgi:alkyl hydroperoxide reductase subunit AhpC